MQTIEEAEQQSRHAQVWFENADVTTYASLRRHCMRQAMHDVEHVMRSLLLMVANASDAHARDVVVNFHETDAG